MVHRIDRPAGNGASNSKSLSLTVLLVEPDWGTRRLYAREIGRVWEVVEAVSVQDARGQIAIGLPSAVVLEPYAGDHRADSDLGVAWEFMQEVKDVSDTIPVVICSVVDERRTAYALGAALYLLKPVTPQQLVAELHRLLDAANQKEHTR